MAKSYRGIVLDLKSEIPLHRQLTSAFRDAIISGKFQPGERISSSRELQACYGISRNTALSALSQLQAEGHLVTVRGSGTFVAGEPDAVRESGAVPFRPGVPALDLFPVDLFRRSLSTLEWDQDLRDDPGARANHGLKTAIVQRLQQTRGIDCSPDQVLIVPSTEYAISLMGRVLLKPHDSVVIEDPGRPKLRSAFLAAGAQVVPALVDEEGIDVASFSRRRAALAYVTPSHQYPTGAALSLERRFALLDWAAEFGAWIVEDDYDNEFDYRCRPQPTLQSLDEGRRVLYVGTFSNVLSPSIRIAYLVAPRRLSATLEAAHQATAGYVSPFLQAALAAFMERGHFARHVARMRKIYDERRRFLSFALGSTGLRVHDCGAGLHFIADVPEHLSDRDVSARAFERGVIVPPLSSYSHGLSAFNGLVFGFAATPMPVARTAVKALLKAL